MFGCSPHSGQIHDAGLWRLLSYTWPALQDWTKQENEDAEGIVSFSYRTKPEEPPDLQTIQKQMAIVAWQPGPNRIVQVPSQVCPPEGLCICNFCLLAATHGLTAMHASVQLLQICMLDYGKRATLFVCSKTLFV